MEKQIHFQYGNLTLYSNGNFHYLENSPFLYLLQMGQLDNLLSELDLMRPISFALFLIEQIENNEYQLTNK